MPPFKWIKNKTQQIGLPSNAAKPDAAWLETFNVVFFFWKVEESFGLEGTLRIIQFHPPATCRDTFLS